MNILLGAFGLLVLVAILENRKNIAWEAKHLASPLLTALFNIFVFLGIIGLLLIGIHAL